MYVDNTDFVCLLHRENIDNYVNIWQFLLYCLFWSCIFSFYSSAFSKLNATHFICFWKVWWYKIPFISKQLTLGLLLLLFLFVCWDFPHFCYFFCLYWMWFEHAIKLVLFQVRFTSIQCCLVSMEILMNKNFWNLISCIYSIEKFINIENEIVKFGTILKMNKWIYEILLKNSTNDFWKIIFFEWINGSKPIFINISNIIFFIPILVFLHYKSW